MIKITHAVNEPIKSYLPKSKERNSLQKKYDEMSQKTYEIPVIINGQEIKTGKLKNCVMPHNHKHVLATFHNASKNEVDKAINSSLNSWRIWSETPLNKRTKILDVSQLSKGIYIVEVITEQEIFKQKLIVE